MLIVLIILCLLLVIFSIVTTVFLIVSDVQNRGNRFITQDVKSAVRAMNRKQIITSDEIEKIRGRLPKKW